MKILTNSILPPKFSIFREDEGGGGSSGGGEGDGKLGSAFSKMLSDMNPEAAAPDPRKDKEPTEAEKVAAAAEKVEKEKSAAAEAEKKKTEDATKKKRGRDPLLDVFEGTKADDKKEEKKPDPAADEAAKKAREAELETATKGMSGAAAANFRKVATERDDAITKAANLEKELAALKANPPKPELSAEVQAKLAELEALKKEHGALQELMEKIGVERSPTYQKKFVQGRQNLIEKAKGLVKKYGGDPAAFAEALNLTGKERSDALANAMADMQPFDVQRVAGVMTELESLDDDAAAYLGDARKSLQEEERNAQAQEQAQAAEVGRLREAKFTEVANRMLRKFPDDHPLAAEANALVDAAVVTAKKFLFENTEFDTFAQAAIAHAMFPEMQKRLAAAGEHIARLEQQLEDLAGADPGNGGSGGGAGDGATKDQKDFAGRYAEAMTPAAA